MADLRADARRIAGRYRINPDVFVRQIQAESGFNPSARSPAGARGIAQFTPSTARQYGVNVNDPISSLDGAARLMRDSLRKTGGDYKAALSIYNSGRPDGYKHISETRNYVNKILGNAPTQGAGASLGPSSPTPATVAAQPQPLDRSAALQQYVAERGRPGALLGLAQGLSAPAASSTQPTVSAPSGTAVDSGTAQQLTSRANAINAKHLPYLWGGGHGGKTNAYSAGPLDCSGAVSSVLGINPRVASQFKTWGKPGAGGTVTIYANDTHTLMEINGHFFGTSATNPGGGAGWIPRSAISPAYLKRFTARHV